MILFWRRSSEDKTTHCTKSCRTELQRDNFTWNRVKHKCREGWGENKGSRQMPFISFQRMVRLCSQNLEQRPQRNKDYFTRWAHLWEAPNFSLVRCTIVGNNRTLLWSVASPLTYSSPSDLILTDLKLQQTTSTTNINDSARPGT